MHEASFPPLPAQWSSCGVSLASKLIKQSALFKSSYSVIHPCPLQKTIRALNTYQSLKVFAAFSRSRYRIFTIQGRLPDFSDSSNLWTGRQFGRRHALCLCCRRSGAAAVCLQLHKETGALFKSILQLRWLCHLVGIICVESWAI